MNYQFNRLFGGLTVQSNGPNYRWILAVVVGGLLLMLALNASGATFVPPEGAQSTGEEIGMCPQGAIVREGFDLGTASPHFELVVFKGKPGGPVRVVFNYLAQQVTILRESGTVTVLSMQEAIKQYSSVCAFYDILNESGA